MWYNKVKPNGYIIFDDTNWTTTQKAQQLLVEKGFTNTYIFSIML